MRITRVHADAFGALRGRTLELGPGLNVVVGPNESGKSTWHAATYAALCGFAAVPDATDQRFAAYRKPRPGPDWAVSAELDLGVVAGHDGAKGFDGEARFDGARRITLRQNLLDPAASTAVERVDDEWLDVSSEIMGGGTLDAARWLGFDRRSYAATSWIEQAGARSALVSIDGRTPLQLAVAACVGEDEAVAALDQLEAVLRGYIGTDATAGGAIARALAEVERCRADRDRAVGLQERRRESLTSLATATGAAEIARKKLAASVALAARAEADRLRAQAPGELDSAGPFDSWSRANGSAGTGIGVRPDAYVHSTVASAEQSLREIDYLIDDLRLRLETEDDAAADEPAEAADLDADEDEDHSDTTPDVDTDPDGEASQDDEASQEDEANLDDDDAASETPTATAEPDDSAATDPSGADHGLELEPRRLVNRPRLPKLDRMPGLDRVWGLDRIRGLGWIRQLDRAALLSISGGSGAVFVLGLVLAIALPSITAMVVAVLAALVLLLALLQLTPSGLARRQAELAAAQPGAVRPASLAPARSTAARLTLTGAAAPALPSTEDLLDDLDRRRDLALTRLSSALTARGRTARPATAESDYENYRLDCLAEAHRRDAETAAGQEQRRAHDERVSRAEQRAEELERAADPYDLNLPYKRDPDSARGAHEEAQAALREATEAVAAVDRDIAAHATVLGAEAAISASQREVERLRRLDRVLVRARDELTIARESVLREIAAGITPRLTDYLAELTDRRYSAAEVTDLHQRIGDSLLLREPELGSFSTSESTYMFTRVALGQHLAGDAPQGPLLVDDITSSADTVRIRRLLRILRRIAAQRQVVVFAHQSQVGKWARGRIATDRGVRLIRLRSIHDDPEIETALAPSRAA